MFTVVFSVYGNCSNALLIVNLNIHCDLAEMFLA